MPGGGITAESPHLSAMAARHAGRCGRTAADYLRAGLRAHAAGRVVAAMTGQHRLVWAVEDATLAKATANAYGSA